MEEHEHLGQEARVQAAKLELMHIIDWEEAQEADALLVACHKWLCLRKDTPLPLQDALLKECLGTEAEIKWQDVLLHLQQPCLEQGPHVLAYYPKR